MLGRSVTAAVFPLLFVLTGVSRGQAQDPAALPSEVSQTTVAQGLDLFHGKGGCSGCHGELGIGSFEAPSLLAGTWKLGGGDYAWLADISRHAGWGVTTRGGDPRPMRGPTVLDSTEVRRVAAFVWAISRGKQASSPSSP